MEVRTNLGVHFKSQVVIPVLGYQVSNSLVNRFLIRCRLFLKKKQMELN